MKGINLQERDNSVSNSAKKARKSGKVPGIVYSKYMNNFMFEVGEIDLGREVSKVGEHGVLNYEINGEEHRGLIKSIQRDSVTHKILHLDVEELEGNQKVVSTVPINYVGEEYLNQKGIVLQKERAAVRVECDVDTLPKVFNFNIGNGEVGSVYKLADLEVGGEISIVDDINTVIASISYERKKVAEVMELEAVIENSENKKKVNE